MRSAVEDTSEYRRIVALPRRLPVPLDLAQRLTEVLRTPNGTMVLRPAQALALLDIGSQGGLLAPIRVGGGKTLISLLAAHVLEAKRPLLLLPAGLVEKTKTDQRTLSRHWILPRHLRVMSYESLGRVGAARELELYRPDLIVADEAHRLKNPRAACTRRVQRWMKEHPDTKFIAMSGTLIKHSIKDFATLSAWSLKEGSPVPIEYQDMVMWANALDEKVATMGRADPGVLGPTTDAARAWFHDRLVSTPGVVTATESGVDCSLRIDTLEVPVNRVTEENFITLRTQWATPDGWTYSQATDIWRHARELALGLHYVWDPRPPQEWLDARKTWAQMAREIIKNSSHSNTPLDSELQVVNAIDRGEMDEAAQIVLADWRRIKPTFDINQRPVWHDDSALRACQAWMAEGPGIVWCEHVFFAKELARRTGASYFAARGIDKDGHPIDQHDGKSAVIASVASCGTGRNLQMFSRNLITSPSPGADGWEQLLGRTHRDGQEADEVTATILMLCAEHFDAIEKALGDARMHQAVLGQEQKLLLADVAWPSNTHVGCRWQRSVA